MTSYEMELLVRDRIQERLQDGERARLARANGTESKRGSWRAKVSLAVVRRLVHVAQAS